MGHVGDAVGSGLGGHGVSPLTAAMRSVRPFLSNRPIHGELNRQTAGVFSGRSVHPTDQHLGFHNGRPQKTDKARCNGEE